MYFATEPTFVSVKVAITPIHQKRFYNLDIALIYTGTDFLYAFKTEENSSFGESAYVYEPYLTKLHFEGVYMIGMAWVEIELKNKVGKACYMVEIPSQLNPDPIIEVTAESSISQVEVRDMQGRLLLQTENYEAVNHLSRGMYIVTITYSDGKVVTKKICP